MEIKSNYSLNRLFINFLFSLSIFLTMGILIPIALFLISLNLGYITPANQGEKDAQTLINKIASEQTFNKKDVSSLNRYLIVSKNFTIKDTNMPKNLQTKAIQFAKSNKQKNTHFTCITMGNQTIVLSFKIKAMYTNSFLNKYFISPEFILILSIINAILIVTILVRSLSKKIKEELLPIGLAVKKIENNDLDFQVGHSNIKELNQILESFEEMKNSLQQALEKKWQSEQKQRQQLTALIHDIKTPLTGAIGWSELLNETVLTTEQAAYTQKLQNNQASIEQLVNSLMELTLDSKKMEQSIQSYHLKNFAYALKTEITDLAMVKSISIQLIEKIDNPIVNFDYQLLHQAVFNILSNAVDFTPINGNIWLTITSNHTNFSIQIEDSGVGFTPEVLVHATDELYMGDSSRSGINHFGMGLAIAKNNSKHLNGHLVLGRSKILNGASVKITIPTSL